MWHQGTLDQNEIISRYPCGVAPFATAIFYSDPLHETKEVDDAKLERLSSGEGFIEIAFDVERA